MAEESNAFGRTMIKVQLGVYDKMIHSARPKVDDKLSMPLQRSRRHHRNAESWRVPFAEMNRRRCEDKSMVDKLTVVRPKVDTHVDEHVYRFRENRIKHPNYVPAWQTQDYINRTLAHHTAIMTGKAPGCKARVVCHADDQAVRHRKFMSTLSFTKGGLNLNELKKKKAAAQQKLKKMRKRSKTQCENHLPARRSGRQPKISCHTVQLPRMPTPQADPAPDAGLIDPWKDSKAAQASTIYTLPPVGSVAPPPPPPRRGVANDQYKDKVSAPTSLPLMKVQSKCEMYTVDVTTRSGLTTPIRGVMTPIRADPMATPRTPFDTSGSAPPPGWKGGDSYAEDDFETE